MMFHELDTVAILRDLPEYGLTAGAEGVVLLTHDRVKPQGLTIEFYIADHDWSPKSDEDYPAITISLPADQVRLVERHVHRATGTVRASDVLAHDKTHARSRRASPSGS